MTEQEIADFLALCDDIRIYRSNVEKFNCKNKIQIPEIGSEFEIYEDGERSGSLRVQEVIKIDSVSDFVGVPENVVLAYMKSRNNNIKIISFIENDIKTVDNKYPEDITLENIAEKYPDIYLNIIDRYNEIISKQVAFIPDVFIKCEYVETNGDESEKWFVLNNIGSFTGLNMNGEEI